MKVTVAKFTYDKADGTAPKDRKLLVLSKPSDTLFGIEFENAAEITKIFAYMAEREQFEEYLKHKYGLSEANYKRFKEDKIQNLTEESIKL